MQGSASTHLPMERFFHCFEYIQVFSWSRKNLSILTDLVTTEILFSYKMTAENKIHVAELKISALMDCAEQTGDSSRPNPVRTKQAESTGRETSVVTMLPDQRKNVACSVLPFSGGEIKEMYFIRGAAGQCPCSCWPCPYHTSILLPPQPLHICPKKQRNDCPAHRYALYSFQSATLKPITAQQSSRAGCRAARSPSPLLSCCYQYPK